MAAERKAMNGWLALAVVVPIALIMAWSQSSTGPSRAELAPLLRTDGDPVRVDDLRDLRCEQSAGQGFECQWHQRMDGGWQRRAARLAATNMGWRLVPVND